MALNSFSLVGNNTCFVVLYGMTSVYVFTAMNRMAICRLTAGLFQIRNFLNIHSLHVILTFLLDLHVPQLTNPVEEILT